MKKNLKKLLSLMLVLVLAISLTACTDNSTPSADDASTGGNTESTVESQPTDDGGEPAEVKEIVFAFETWTGAPVDTQLVEDAMNEILVPKLGAKVKLQISDSGSYNQNMTLALSGGEKIDIMGTLGLTYPSLVQQGYLRDLEENDLIQTYGQGIIDAVGQANIDACRIGGVLYGLPNNRDLAQGRGSAAVATQYLDLIGYTPSGEGEIEEITLEELNDIYAQIHEAAPDKEIYRPVIGSMSQFSNIDPLGGSVFGVLLDYGEELKVENLFESDYYKDYCQMRYEQNQMGYISADAATDTTAVGEIVKAGTLVGYTTAGKPGIKAQESSLCGEPMTIFQTRENFITSAAIASFPYAIPINSTEPELAMQVLSEFYTNPDLANIFTWGIEGKHYVIKDDGLLTYPEGVDASNSGWNHSMTWMMPNQYITLIWEGNDPDMWTKMKEFNDTAVRSAAVGFTFDTANVQTELTAVQNVYDEYQKSVEFGMVDPATAIPEMNEKMMTAGLQKIIDEKQAQLDAWAAL